MKSLIKNPTNIGLFLISTLFLIISCSDSNSDSNPISDNYLEIPDPNFETLLIEQGIDSDGIVNQQMLKADAAKIHKLDLNLTSNFGDIEDLTGIEGFVNITYLSAAGQKLETVDLSQNTKLDTLLLQNNYLTSIDVGNNPNLILVDVLSNELTTITGLAETIGLKKLNVSWNNLEDFSIINGSLETLHISKNFLRSFDVTGAPNLKNILLTTNALTSVDLSANTALETLLISDNNLQHISLENNTKLAYVYASSNSLTQLDVSHNPELVDLRVDRNPDLNCIKIASGQEIPTVSLSEHQELNTVCE